MSTFDEFSLRISSFQDSHYGFKVWNLIFDYVM